jgi:hypothetical protein
MATNGQCQIKVSLLSSLSALPWFMPSRRRCFPAYASTSNHDGFNDAMKLCAETELMYQASRNALKGHLLEHGC